MDATIDLNADLGETVAGVPTADDDAVFGVISSASIACGGHAGDEASMSEAIGRARRHSVAIGAHPSYVDRAGFGRIEQQVAPDVLRRQVSEQLSRLVSLGADLTYVKPHGALYHRVTVDAEVADAVADAVAETSERIGRALPLLGLAGRVSEAAERRGLPFFREAFLDRGYLPSGGLVPRTDPRALVTDPVLVAERAVRLVTEGVVEAVDGSLVRPEAVSLCVHGDSPGAVAMARAVRRMLETAGVGIAAPW